MLYFLEAVGDIKKVIPTIGDVKEKIANDEFKLNSYFDNTVHNLIDYVPRVISSVIVLIVGLWVINWLARIAEKAMEARHLEVSLRTFLRSLLSIGLKIILIVTVAGMIGIGTASFVTILGAAGLAVGLALQGSLSNFAGGVLILIFKPFKVGDNIEAGGQSGEVLEIQIFNTILLTGEHKTVILPNGPLSNGTIVNTTRHGDLRIEVEFRISTANDIEYVKALIYKILGDNTKVIHAEQTEIVIGKFSDGILHMYARPYCLPVNTSLLISEIYTAAKEEFEKSGIKLAVIK